MRVKTVLSSVTANEIINRDTDYYGFLTSKKERS